MSYLSEDFTPKNGDGIAPCEGAGANESEHAARNRTDGGYDSGDNIGNKSSSNERCEDASYDVVKSITLPAPDAETIEGLPDATDRSKWLADSPSLVNKRNGQLLAISDAMRESLVATGEFALLAKSLQGVTTELASNAFAAIEVMRPAVENVRTISLRMQGAMHGALESASVVLDYMARFNESYSEYLANSRRIAEALTPMVKALRESRIFFDFDERKQRHELWGEYGWVLFDEMPTRVANTEPGTWAEANKLASVCIDGDVIAGLFSSLRSIVAKQSDLDDAIALFNEKRYKPCAMMICSLIECCLYKRSKKPEGKSERRMKEPLKRLEAQLREEGYAVFSLLGTLKAFDYFYKYANDFDREREGELNRNFLMHGMMYRRVSRVACIKLFMLLLSVERLVKRL